MIERTLQEIAETLGGTVSGPGAMVVNGLAGLEDAGPGDLSFVRGRGSLAAMQASGAGALLLPPGLEPDRPAIVVQDPHVSFVRLLAWLVPDTERVFPPGVHPSAVVDSTARLGPEVALGPGCVVGPEVTVGARSRLGPQVVLEAGSSVGEDCLLYSGAVVRYGCILGDRVILHPRAIIGNHSNPSRRI